MRLNDDLHQKQQEIDQNQLDEHDEIIRNMKRFEHDIQILEQEERNGAISPEGTTRLADSRNDFASLAAQLVHIKVLLNTDQEENFFEVKWNESSDTTRSFFEDQAKRQK